MVERKLVSVMKYENEHIYYLTKEGAEQVDGTPGRRISSLAMEHTLLRTESWILLGKPDKWFIEKEISLDGDDPKNVIRPDAFYFIGEDLYCVEIDNKSKMSHNREKIERYKILTENYYEDTGRKPIVQFFVTVPSRKEMLMQIAEDNFVHVEVRPIFL